nr:MAG TPA: protein of unknown function DUF859 [Caudoviricetes sp.]
MQTNTPISLEELSNYILNKCYPVGTYYWTDNPANPSTLLGGGAVGTSKRCFHISCR